MAKVRGDHGTLDLLDWQPPRIALGYGQTEPVKATSVDQTIARAVSRTLKDDPRPRAEIAEAMSGYLGDDVTEHMLNAYASPARDTHRISLERAVALIAVTGDARLAGELLLPLGYAVIEKRYLPAVDEAIWAEREERARTERQAARRKWIGGGR